MSITLSFQPWFRFRAHKDNAAIKAWLQSIGDAGTTAFRGGMGSYPPGSAAGDWPASRSGALRASIRSEVTAKAVTIGTNMRYSAFLRSGTSKMGRRKMSDNALQEGIKGASQLKHWVEWTRF